MEEKINWYKLLNIKRKKDDIELNDENSNNFELKDNYKKKKIEPISQFEFYMNRLKDKFNKLKNNVSSIINEKSFSLKKILSKKMNIQQIDIEEKKEQNEIITKTTNDYTIKNIEENIKDDYKNGNVNYGDNDESIINKDSNLDEYPSIPNLASINKNCK